MMWIVVLVVMALSAFTGFLVGVAYGQEHRDE